MPIRMVSHRENFSVSKPNPNQISQSNVGTGLCKQRGFAQNPIVKNGSDFPCVNFEEKNLFLKVTAFASKTGTRGETDSLRPEEEVKT